MAKLGEVVKPDVVISASGEEVSTSNRMTGVPLDDMTETVNALLYGGGGTGKTSALAAMANLGRVLYINAEGGIKARPLRKLGVKTENIVVIPDARKGQELTFQLMEDWFWQLQSDLVKDPGSWVGVVWDSITEIHQKLLRGVMDYQVAKAERTGQSRMKGTAIPGDIADRFFTDLSDYGVMTQQVRDLLKKYRDLPCHFGASALYRRDVDKDDGRAIYRPAVTPALVADLDLIFDVTGYTEVIDVDGDELYRAWFRPVGKFKGKDRLHALPRALVDPSFDRIVAYVNETLDVESDDIMADAKARLTNANIRMAEKAAQDDPETDPEIDNE